MTDALAELTANGVAVWLDDMSRDRIRTGNLADLIRDRHLVGATTNPTIFQRAITGSELYDSQLRDLAHVDAAQGEVTQLAVIELAAGDCSLEDRRVGGSTHQVPVPDQVGEVAGPDPVPAHVVEPDRDAVRGLARRHEP